MSRPARLSELAIERVAASFEPGISAQVPLDIYISCHSSFPYGEPLSMLYSLTNPSQRSLASTRSSHIDFVICDNFASLNAHFTHSHHSLIHLAAAVVNRSMLDRISVLRYDGTIFVVALPTFTAIAHFVHKFAAVHKCVSANHSDFAVPRIPRISFAIRLYAFVFIAPV